MLEAVALPVQAATSEAQAWREVVSDYRKGTAYLQVVATRYPYELKVVKATQKKPTVIEPDSVVVKVTIQIPRAAFEPLQPEAVVTVPAELVQHPVEVEAVDADA